MIPVGETGTILHHLRNVFPGAPCGRREGAGDGCRMWFVNLSSPGIGNIFAVIAACHVYECILGNNTNIRPLKPLWRAKMNYNILLLSIKPIILVMTDFSVIIAIIAIILVYTKRK